LKILTGSIRFRFYKPETEKTKPNPNRKKTGKKSRVKPVFLLKNEPNRNRSVWTSFGFFFKIISVWLFFFIKTEPNRKWSPPTFNTIIYIFIGLFSMKIESLLCITSIWDDSKTKTFKEWKGIYAHNWPHTNNKTLIMYKCKDVS
jgi:hypothetical protein